MVLNQGRCCMVNGITFNLGKKVSSGNPVFKVEYGDYTYINEIIYEEVTLGYEPVCISCDGRLCFILFKKRGS